MIPKANAWSFETPGENMPNAGTLWSIATMLLVCGSSALALDVPVNVVIGDAAGDCAEHAELVAAADAGSTRMAVPLVKNSRSYRLHLPDSGIWRVGVVRSGCWSEKRAWTAGSGDVEVHVYRASTIEVPLPPRLRGKMTSAVFLQREMWAPGSIATNTDECAVVGGKARCVVPGDVPFDLRLDASGYAAVYLFDQKIAGGTSVQAGITFEPGASIAGVVHAPNDKPVRNSTISCFPMELLGARDHVPLRIQSVRTDPHGFFQCTGLGEGRYRVVADSPGFSPAVVSDVLLRPGESMVVPKAIRHLPATSVDVVLEPARDPQNNAWRVQLHPESALFPSSEQKPIARAATSSGQWTATGLRADMYTLEVRTAAGALVERRVLDMASGGRHNLLLNVHIILVRGTVLAGDRPLHADLDLSGPSGAFVRVSANADGSFETPLPSAGVWHVVVLYPPERSSARVNAEPLRIAEEPSDTPQNVVIRIPGGRIHGKVVGRNGERSKAAVHARQGNRVPAQQMADDNGEFDLIGLAEGHYLLDAQNVAGSTPAPVPVELAKDESREVTLTTEPMLTVSGRVITANGHPASGAVVKMSANDGSGWQYRVADAKGQYTFDVNRSTSMVQLVVVTYDEPVAFLSVSPGDGESNEQVIRLSSTGGVVRVPRPMETIIAAKGVLASFGLLRYSLYDQRPDGGVYLEPGAYVICERNGNPPPCRNINVTPGSDWNVDPRVQAER